ncbi:MAG: hypothetical protein ACJAYF_003993, partial [Arenicella sp.]
VKELKALYLSVFPMKNPLYIIISRISLERSFTISVDSIVLNHSEFLLILAASHQDRLEQKMDICLVNIWPLLG